MIFLRNDCVKYVDILICIFLTPYLKDVYIFAFFVNILYIVFNSLYTYPIVSSDKSSIRSSIFHILQKVIYFDEQ